MPFSQRSQRSRSASTSRYGNSREQQMVPRQPQPQFAPQQYCTPEQQWPAQQCAPQPQCAPPQQWIQPQQQQPPPNKTLLEVTKRRELRRNGATGNLEWVQHKPALSGIPANVKVSGTIKHVHHHYHHNGSSQGHGHQDGHGGQEPPPYPDSRDRSFDDRKDHHHGHHEQGRRSRSSSRSLRDGPRHRGPVDRNGMPPPSSRFSDELPRMNPNLTLPAKGHDRGFDRGSDRGQERGRLRSDYLASDSSRSSHDLPRGMPMRNQMANPLPGQMVMQPGRFHEPRERSMSRPRDRRGDEIGQSRTRSRSGSVSRSADAIPRDGRGPRKGVVQHAVWETRRNGVPQVVREARREVSRQRMPEVRFGRQRAQSYSSSRS